MNGLTRAGTSLYTRLFWLIRYATTAASYLATNALARVTALELAASCVAAFFVAAFAGAAAVGVAAGADTAGAVGVGDEGVEDAGVGVIDVLKNFLPCSAKSRPHERF